MWKSLFWLTIFCELFNPKKKKLNFSAIYKTITVILSLVFFYKVYFLKDLSKLQYQENLEKSSVQVKFDQECRNLNFIWILLLCFATESLDLNCRVQNIQINTNKKPLCLKILLFLSFLGGQLKLNYGSVIFSGTYRLILISLLNNIIIFFRLVAVSYFKKGCNTVLYTLENILVG